MYLFKHFTLVALSFGLLYHFQITEGTVVKADNEDFTYVTEVLNNVPANKNGPIPSRLLASYAARAYVQMERLIGLNSRPAVMTALW